MVHLVCIWTHALKFLFCVQNRIIIRYSFYCLRLTFHSRPPPLNKKKKNPSQPSVSSLMALYHKLLFEDKRGEQERKLKFGLNTVIT